jgi:hypothetical protein
VAKRKRVSRKIHDDGTESHLERTFQAYWSQYYPNNPPITQLLVLKGKPWRFDFSWPLHKVAVEIQGMGPGHCSLVGMTKDYNKHRAALLNNWKVVYLTKTHLLPENIEQVCHDIARLLGIFKPETTFGYVPMHKRKRL